MSVAELFDKAQGLPLAEREQLTMMLLDTLPEGEDAPIEIDEEYQLEIDRRLERIRTGQSKGHSIEEVMTQLKETLRHHSSP
jgi:putative addiction module component (TIGR02574 family)